jgi:hypothetical protein
MSAQDLILQFIPSIFMGVILAIPVFLIARKRRANAWLWAILTVVPVLGFVVVFVFYTNTFLWIMDRLNKLEADKTFS